MNKIIEKDEIKVKLHWHLDFIFKQDSNTINKIALMNLGLINKFCLAI